MNERLEEKSKLYRQQIFEFKIMSKFGHLASCLSCVDIVNSLYNDPETYFDHKEDALIFLQSTQFFQSSDIFQKMSLKNTVHLMVY